MKPVLVIYESELAPVKFRQKRARVYGTCEHGKPTKLVLDPRQGEEEFLDTLVHELHHHMDPEASEQTVIDRAALFSSVLWRMGYRRVRL